MAPRSKLTCLKDAQDKRHSVSGTLSSLTDLETYTYDRIVEDARKPMAYRMLL